MSEWSEDSETGWAPEIMPAVVPMQWMVQRVQAPGQDIIALSVYTPVGQAVYLLSPDDAKGIAAMLTAEIELVNGLEIPPVNEWADEVAGINRFTVPAGTCNKGAKPHKAHDWDEGGNELDGVRTYFHCDGNW